jgi:hypothetical protein
VVLMAILPLFIFMSGTYMSHPANLLLFGLFCWAWARMLNRESLGAAAIAGMALGFNLLVRPVDSAVVTLPFLLQLAFHIRRRPRLVLHALTVGVLASGGIAATLAYNQALTGDPMLMPVTQYFMARDPGEHFGIGFGPDMGTKMHGEEWPGFTPVDGVRVTAYRLVEFLKDLYGMPIVALVALGIGLRSQWRQWGEWRLVLIGSGVALLSVYYLHFYHGIAYGSRHYYLAVPAVIVVLANLLGREANHTGRLRPAAAAGVLTLLVTTVTFTIPPLVREYGDGYRGASPAIAEAVEKAGIHKALVFVETGAWSWKSAFPLNRYPLDTADLLFARDRGPANAQVIAEFPNRSVYYLAIGPADQVNIRPATQPVARP